MPPEFATVILPAYNEAEAIQSVVRDIKQVMDQSAYDYEILVVDDGSSDDTAEKAKNAGARVVKLDRNYGVGRARKVGIRNAKGELIVMIDADGTYPAKRIPACLEGLKHADMIIGARQQEMGTSPKLRHAAKEIIRRFACLITAEEIPDLNSGLRAFRRSIAFRFMNILPNSHSWVSTITIAYLANEYRVSYVPIEYYKRIGKSTFHPIKDTFNYISLIARTVLFFSPFKFFIPASVFITGFGLVKLVYDWRWHSDIRESDIMIVLTGIIIATLGLLADLIVKQHRYHYIKKEPDYDETH